VELTTVAVTGVRLTSDGELQIVGTVGRDHIILTEVGDDWCGGSDGRTDGGSDKCQVKVITQFDQGDGTSDSWSATFLFDSSDVQRITAYLGQGDDDFQMNGGDDSDGSSDGGLDIPAEVHGDAGDDRIRTGGGNDILLGGPGDDDLDGRSGDDLLDGGDGDDKLNGGEGRDVLIGGRDKDDLQGGNGDDLLIGGFTAFESHVANSRLIMAEWRSERSYEERVDNLRHGSGPLLSGAGVRLQASGPERTVFDDGSKDKLTGDKDRDWFFASLLDNRKDDEHDEEFDQL
jgi:Ca2+-binding RTX toxin-like protein